MPEPGNLCTQSCLRKQVNSITTDVSLIDRLETRVPGMVCPHRQRYRDLVLITIMVDKATTKIEQHSPEERCSRLQNHFKELLEGVTLSEDTYGRAAVRAIAGVTHVYLVLYKTGTDQMDLTKEELIELSLVLQNLFRDISHKGVSDLCRRFFEDMWHRQRSSLRWTGIVSPVLDTSSCMFIMNDCSTQPITQILENARAEKAVVRIAERVETVRRGMGVLLVRALEQLAGDPENTSCNEHDSHSFDRASEKLVETGARKIANDRDNKDELEQTDLSILYAINKDLPLNFLDCKSFSDFLKSLLEDLSHLQADMESEKCFNPSLVLDRGLTVSGVRGASRVLGACLEEGLQWHKFDIEQMFTWTEMALWQRVVIHSVPDIEFIASHSFNIGDNLEMSALRSEQDLVVIRDKYSTPLVDLSASLDDTMARLLSCLIQVFDRLLEHLKNNNEDQISAEIANKYCFELQPRVYFGELLDRSTVQAVVKHLQEAQQKNQRPDVDDIMATLLEVYHLLDMKAKFFLSLNLQVLVLQGRFLPAPPFLLLQRLFFSLILSTGNTVHPDSSAGNTDSSAGNTDSSAGNTDSSAGNTDSSAGNTDSSAGNTDSSAGNTDSSAGNTDSSAGNTDSSAGNTDSSAGNTDSSAGNTDSSAVNTDSSAGNTDSSAGNTDSSAGNTDSSAGNTDSSAGNTYSRLRREDIPMMHRLPKTTCRAAATTAAVAVGYLRPPLSEETVYLVSELRPSTARKQRTVRDTLQSPGHVVTVVWPLHIKRAGAGKLHCNRNSNIGGGVLCNAAAETPTSVLQK
ncbi:hypothetical protein FHG87_013204 [Trinorchestia longiramus]|nr:hypothetical protein FHG87_013204 [Trinorchestia longiramus]